VWFIFLTNNLSYFAMLVIKMIFTLSNVIAYRVLAAGSVVPGQIFIKIINHTCLKAIVYLYSPYSQIIMGLYTYTIMLSYIYYELHVLKYTNPVCNCYMVSIALIMSIAVIGPTSTYSGEKTALYGCCVLIFIELMNSKLSSVMASMAIKDMQIYLYN